jgi:hypothetical protein
MNLSRARARDDCGKNSPSKACGYLVIPTPAVIPVYDPPSTATLPFTIT